MMTPMAAVRLADQWTDYELLDAGDGMKQERWGDYVLVRPDPQIIWPRASHASWDRYDAIYRRSSAGGGRWEFKRPLPDAWTVRYRNLVFSVRPTGFKHVGLFPEQAVNWDWLDARIRSRAAPVSLLNLFGYTGGATLAAAAAGARVCHVDAAPGMVAWCRRNAELCGLGAAPIRTLVDDCPRFVRREARRGVRYDAIVMDPPSFGRGRHGEVWKLEDHLWELVQECRRLLTDQPLLFLVNCYTAHLSPRVIANLVADAFRVKPDAIDAGELGLRVRRDGKILPCGVAVRWQA